MTLPASWQDRTVRGLLHVHSRASDGRGTLDEIAAAAGRAGLQFLIVTDHGDGTRKPEAPSYRSGVLMVDAVEISTRQGHYLAIGLPQAPYALGGAAADVVEDVRRLGGIGIAAHPDSPKNELRWADWTAPVDGFELVNPDTSWRVHAFSGGMGARWQLLRSLLAYPVRPAEAISQLLTASSTLRERWMAIAAERPLIAVAGWGTLSSLVSIKNDTELDLPELQRLLQRVQKTIHQAPDALRYQMNAFVIAVGSYVPSLTATAIQTAEKIGPVTADLGNNSCQVPFAPDYIRKVQQRGTIGKKRKSAKC
jgi:hypothetical protein